HRHGAGRERIVGRRGGEHDEVDRLGIDLGVGERRLRRVGGQIGGQFARRSDAALVDAGALYDPIVGGVDLARQVGVGQDLRRQIAAAAENDRARQRHEATPPSAWSGDFGRLSAAVILANSSSRTTSWPSAMAAAKPSASAPPWLLMTMPLSPRNTPPLALRVSIASRSSRNAARANR